VLVVCPNLAVDRTLTIPRLARGETQRATSVVALAGANGANAARVARALGGDPLLVGFAGGAAGEVLRARLAADGIAARLVTVAGETRFTVALVEPDGTATLVNEPGPEVTREECERLLEAAASARPSEPALLTGSLPPGVPDTLYAELCSVLGERAVVVDARGTVLAAAVAAAPFLVKPNLVEASGWGADPVEASAALVAAGAAHALVTTPQEAVLDGALRLRPPAVAAVNPTGSGDALAGALLAGLEGGRSLEDAVRLGLAAAAENATQPVAGRVDPARVRELEARVAEV
jgi:tagatose 6-phosphate kinase